MPDHVRRAVFRAYVVYGAARLVGWFLWARLLNPKRGTETMDLSWTGPGWVEAPPRFQVASTWGGFAAATIVGVAGTALTAYLAWQAMSRLPERRRSVIPAVRAAECAGADSLARAVHDDVTSETVVAVPGAVSRVPSVADT